MTYIVIVALGLIAITVFSVVFYRARSADDKAEQVSHRVLELQEINRIDDPLLRQIAVNDWLTREDGARK